MNSIILKEKNLNFFLIKVNKNIYIYINFKHINIFFLLTNYIFFSKNLSFLKLNTSLYSNLNFLRDFLYS